MIPKSLVFLIVSFLFTFSKAQVSVDASFGWNDFSYANGMGLGISYQYNFDDKLNTQTSAHFHHLTENNNFLDAYLRNNAVVLNQTIGVNAIVKNHYKLLPRLGIHYRWNNFYGEMEPPLGEIPIRFGTYGIKGGDECFCINSLDNPIEKHRYNMLGYTIRASNQFSFSNQFLLEATPFIEVDFDNSQKIGGLRISYVF